MVNFQRVLGELKRTAYTGLGTFGSATVGNLLSDNLPVDQMGVSVAQYALGGGAAYFVDDRMNVRETRGLDLDVGEAAYFASHGVGAAGFAEAAEMVSGGSAQSSMVEVREVNRGSSNSGSSQHRSGRNAVTQRDFLADVG